MPVKNNFMDKEKKLETRGRKAKGYKSYHFRADPKDIDPILADIKRQKGIGGISEVISGYLKNWYSQAQSGQ